MLKKAPIKAIMYPKNGTNSATITLLTTMLVLMRMLTGLLLHRCHLSSMALIIGVITIAYLVKGVITVAYIAIFVLVVFVGRFNVIWDFK